MKEIKGLLFSITVLMSSSVCLTGKEYSINLNLAYHQPLEQLKKEGQTASLGFKTSLSAILNLNKNYFHSEVGVIYRRFWDTVSNPRLRFARDVNMRINNYSLKLGLGYSRRIKVKSSYSLEPFVMVSYQIPLVTNTELRYFDLFDSLPKQNELKRTDFKDPVNQGNNIGGWYIDLGLSFVLGLKEKREGITLRTYFKYYLSEGNDDLSTLNPAHRNLYKRNLLGFEVSFPIFSNLRKLKESK